MRIKAKSSRPKLGLPMVVFSCLFFFIAGFFASAIFFQDAPTVKPRLRLLEVVNEEGHKSIPHGESGEDAIGSIPFQVLSWKPRALYFPNFATAEECQIIVKMAKASLKPSSLALRKGETIESTKGTRTSSGTFISASEDKTGTLGYIEEKIARATMIPRAHGEAYTVTEQAGSLPGEMQVMLGDNNDEMSMINRIFNLNPGETDCFHQCDYEVDAFNILRYEVDQKYDSHYDAFNPSEYGPQSSQRIASFLLYLSNVEEGGETVFPLENGVSIGRGFSFKQCTGLKVKPRQGDGLLFYSLFPNGTIDLSSLHGSCPVTKGEKWVATKWIRDQREGEN